MKLKDFDFYLPSELIAQYPSSLRHESRLLINPNIDNNLENKIIDDIFLNVSNFINSNDLLVFNDTKVIKARLYGNKDSGGAIQILIERILANNQALIQIKSNKSPQIGQTLYFDKYNAKVIARQLPFYHVQFNSDILNILEECGHLPLPPYITREDNEQDEQRYQSIFAKNLGAVAAPTASLHFDDVVMQTLQNKGIKHDYLTLHVGSGTFMPVKHENIYEHTMHSEQYCINQTLIDNISIAKNNGGRIIAVGTTVLRALESFYTDHEKYKNQTNIFITPGYNFKIIDGLITNFHLPKSTLLMLVASFIGLENVHKIYQHAINNKYRFFSYGDAMLCWRK